MRGQGATNVIAITASEAKKGKGGTKEGFVAETLNKVHRLKSSSLKSIGTDMAREQSWIYQSS